MKISTFIMILLIWANHSGASSIPRSMAWSSESHHHESERLPASLLAMSPIPISGKYSWSFKIPLMGSQVMTYVFSAQAVDVTMKGSVLDRAYKLTVISFDRIKNKIVARTVRKKEEIYAVIFLKDIKPDRVTIFKKEFPTLKEANNFGLPPANTTESRGWNVFIKNGN